MDIQKHKILLINIGGIVLFFLVAFIVFNAWITNYTDHGVEVVVPDFSNLDIEAAKILAQKEGLEIKVGDTLCADGVEPGAIVDHYPTAGTKVKRGRTIFLSINSLTPIMVAMPKVTDVSLRQATQILENKGLRVGNLEYKPDFANNYVFEQRYHSRQITPGTNVPKGSAIDLLVGRGGSDVQVPIPSLIGLSWKTISDSLVSRGLNVNPIFGENVKTMADSMKSLVQKQSPVFVDGGQMAASGTIDIWLDLDPIYQSILESESAKK